MIFEQKCFFILPLYIKSPRNHSKRFFDIVSRKCHEKNVIHPKIKPQTGRMINLKKKKIPINQQSSKKKKKI